MSEISGALPRSRSESQEVQFASEQAWLGKMLNKWIEKGHVTPIILSPHCDDAEASMGGEMYILNRATRGKLIHIVVFSAGLDDVKSPYIDHLLQRNGDQGLTTARQLYAERKNEVLAADQLLGIAKEQISFLDFPDLPFREAQQPSILYRALKKRSFTLPYTSRDDRKVLHRLQEIFRKLQQSYENPIFFAPIGGFRRHKDHQIVRQAVEEVFPEERTLYYDEYPYNLFHSPNRWVLKKCQASLAIIDGYQHRRYQALLCFPTQVPEISHKGQFLPPDALPAERLFIPRSMLARIQSNR
ncbi:MAG: PIG-L family deacetylase [Ktedonobacteraceae bacterium]|nr:PIG-L family deacetylase [Ktedonobacteraceae bacterium]MBO0796403.1 PIG-L family deacetylase [Ktedonobacteraceae bacterium]